MQCDVLGVNLSVEEIVEQGLQLSAVLIGTWHGSNSNGSSRKWAVPINPYTGLLLLTQVSHFWERYPKSGTSDVLLAPC